MIYITLPALNNTIVTVLVLNLAKVMNLFESVFVLQNDAVIKVSDVLQTYKNTAYNRGKHTDRCRIPIIRNCTGVKCLRIDISLPRRPEMVEIFVLHN